jgi:hypothetical protein
MSSQAIQEAETESIEVHKNPSQQENLDVVVQGV